MTAPTSSPGAVVLDANVVIALASREVGRATLVATELARYGKMGHQLFAPGVISAETLYVLCGKLSSGALSPTNYAAAVVAFQRTMTTVQPPPSGDVALISRAEQISNGYGCSRSADGIYIALAEELQQSVETVLLTFDQSMPNQAANKAPSVTVQLL